MALGYELEDILEEFDPTTLTKARGIRRAGKIIQLEVGDGWLRGKVRGSQGQTYKQDIKINRRRGGVRVAHSGSAATRGGLSIQGECSCPMDYNCKHVAALLLEALEGSLEQSDHPSLPTAKPIRQADAKELPAELLERLLKSGKVVRLSDLTPPTPPTPSIARELEAWLQSASQPRLASGEVPLESLSNRLLFLVDVLQANGEWMLVVKLRSIKLSGGRENGQPSELRNLSSSLGNLPKYMQPDQALLQRLLRLHSGFFSGGDFRIPAQLFGDEVLQLLLNTGRVYWKKYSGQPLELSPPRQGQPTWAEDSKGVQRPAFNIQPSATAVLPLGQLWYVDAPKNLVGVLETGLSPQLVSLFLRCPPIAPDQAEAFVGRFPAPLKGLLPLPKTVAVEDVFPAPKPLLRLFAREIKYSWNAVPLVALAEPSFVYGPQRFKPSDPEQFLQRNSEKVLRIHRDISNEQTLLKSLRSTGLRPVQGHIYSVPKELADSYTFSVSNAQTEAEWLEFVSEALPKLRKTGWEIEIEAGFPYSIVEAEDWFANLEQSQNDWFGLELGIVVEGQPVNLIPVLVEFIRSTKLSSKVLSEMDESQVLFPKLPDGQRLRIEAGRVKSILSVLVELYGDERFGGGKLRLPVLDASRLAELEASLKLRWHGGEKLLELGRKLRDFAGIEAIEPPPNLQATLRPYQLQGMAWLQFLRQYNLSGILADDMGLGKTVQTLAHLLLEKQAGRTLQPSLIVAPTSVLHNWQAEAERFAPDLRVLVLHGKERSKLFEQMPHYDLVLTTYPLLLRDLEALKLQHFHLLVLDEAQYIKNARSGAAQAASGLKATHRLALTGTPLENHLGELWSLFNFLMPGFLGQADQFKKIYRNPIEKGGDSLRSRALTNKVRPFMLRRTKELVAKELPAKSEFVVKVDLAQSQRDLYETLRVAMHSRVQEEIAERGLARSQIMVLDALLKLRQSCCDPRLLSLAAAKKVKESAKLEWLQQNLPQMLEEGRRVLLFSQFATMLGLLEPLLEDEKIPYVKLTGESQNRAELVKTFQSGQAQVFLISLKAGGVGLNLTAADTVIHYDPWWNPAAENQATDRAHRIGQTKPVFVYKLIASGSVEEKILQLQERKAALARGILEGSLTSSVALTTDDLNYLFAPLG